MQLSPSSVPPYLCRLLGSCLDHRMLLYDTDQGIKKMSISAGVPQGSILGPTLWNVMYNGALTLGLPTGAEVIGFADDIDLTVLGESIEEIELLTSDSGSRIASWMQQMRLEIAHKKTEFLIISSHKTVQSGSIQVGDERIVEYACNNVIKVEHSLIKIMPNIGGPKSSCSRLLAGVAISRFRYNAAIWVHVLVLKEN